MAIKILDAISMCNTSDIDCWDFIEFISNLSFIMDPSESYELDLPT